MINKYILDTSSTFSDNNNNNNEILSVSNISPLSKIILGKENIEDESRLLLTGLIGKIEWSASQQSRVNVQKRRIGKFKSLSVIDIVIDKPQQSSSSSSSTSPPSSSSLRWDVEDQFDKYQSLFQEAFKYLVDNDPFLSNGKYRLIVEFYENHPYLASFYIDDHSQQPQQQSQQTNNNVLTRCLLDLDWINECNNVEEFDHSIKILILSMVLKYWIECSRSISYPSNVQRDSLHSLFGYLYHLHTSTSSSSSSSSTSFDDTDIIKRFNNFLNQCHQRLIMDSSLLFQTVMQDIFKLYHQVHQIFNQRYKLSNYPINSSMIEYLLYQNESPVTIVNNPPSSASSTSTLPLSFSKNDRQELIDILDKVDTKISMYLGQIHLDLPYDRHALRQVLEIQDTTERRQASYEVIKTFSSNVESNNAIRLSSKIRESWLNNINDGNDGSKQKEQHFKPVIVVGRESRAFSNQASLFASAGYICINESIRDAIATIDRLSSEENIRTMLKGSEEDYPSSIRQDILQLVDRLSHLTDHLSPAVARLRGLVANVHGGLAPSTQIHGAVQHLREALSIITQKSMSLIEDLQKSTLARLVEGVHRRKGYHYQSTQNSSNANLDSTGFKTLYNIIESLYSRVRGAIWMEIYRLEDAIGSVPTVPSSFSVLLQRPSVSGSERFRANELEPKNEQEQVLQKLVRIGGANLYMSPSNEWVEHATDLIEAVPLFIYERTIEVDGKHTTVFEVDQEGLEQTIRQLAEHWTKNIRLTILSEHCAFARDIISLAQNQNDPLRLSLDDIIAVTNYLESEYDQLAEKVEELIEKNWKQSNFIPRIEALRLILLPLDLTNDERLELCKEIVTKSIILYQSISKENKDRIAFMAFKKQRNMPAFHLLTTEAPGLVEGFIQAILEEEMTLKNIIEYHKLEKLVNEKIKEYNQEISTFGKKVINEFNYNPIVEQYMSQLSIDENSAILRVVNDHVVIQKQVSLLIILNDLDKLTNNNNNNNDNSSSPPVSSCEESKRVLDLLSRLKTDSEKNLFNIRISAIENIFKQNMNDKEFHRFNPQQQLNMGDQGLIDQIEQVILSNQVYKEEYNNFIVCEARFKALEQASLNEYADLCLMDRLSKLYRSRTALARTNARREIISKYHLHYQMTNPRLSWSCGAVFLNNHQGKEGEEEEGGHEELLVRPTGSRKRYHFIYGPSRVNLGKDERKSVEIWPQFVGATDPLCAKHAKEFYSLINHQPIVRTITAAENLKVSENQWTALIRAVRNVQALFVERLGVGDIEDLAFQFNQRGGLATAAQKESEAYMSGPTAGYCIPKDLLFKLFVVTHQDSRKLSHIGIPKHLHPMIIQLMVDVASKQSQFHSSNEWEKWVSQSILSKESLEKRFTSSDTANEISNYFKQYIELNGGVILLHLTKLCQILGSVGVPSPLVRFGRDLHSALWSGWAEKKITLGGEQVNRSVVFPMTREIPESGKLSSRLNPAANIASEQELRVHMFGVYKGDDDQKPPPDVRFAWVMRAFLIMSGHYKEVALSLDEEGQIVARLSWHGFHPQSNNVEDIKARQYLARHFLDVDDFDMKSEYHQQMIERLQHQFPQHTTVGDITVTAVPGVSSDDLLGFSAETLTLLGEEADHAQDILRGRAGMSIDQMAANARLHNTLNDWAGPLANLPQNERQIIKDAVGAKVHPLALRLRGPGDNFLRDLQSQDIVVFSIIHPQLLSLNPAHLRDLMLIGRPNSALVALDHISQGRHRCWFERDVMLWYAAARSIDKDGNRINKWDDRNKLGRKAVYKAFGWGNDHYQPLLGTDLREEVNRLENRAMFVYAMFQQIVGIDSSGQHYKERLQAMETMMQEQLFNKSAANRVGASPLTLSPDQLQQEIEIQIQYEQRVLLANRFKKRDQIIRESLEEIRDSPYIRSITPLRWLALGGYLLLNGTTHRFVNRILNVIQKGYNRLNQLKDDGKLESFLETDSNIQTLIVPMLATSKVQLKDRKGKMFSVKASEEHLETAVTRRKELQIQSKKNTTLKWRENGYLAIGLPLYTNCSKANSLDAIEKTLIVTIRDNIKVLTNHLSDNNSTNIGSAEEEKLYNLVGSTLNQCIKVLLAMVKFVDDDYQQQQSSTELLVKTIEQLGNSTKGKEIDLKCWDRLIGSYEEFGLLNQLYEQAYRNTQFAENLPMWLQFTGYGCEMLSTLLLFEKMVQYLFTPLEDINETSLWRSLAEFYAKTIDDHYSEYTPWGLDPKRYPRFSSLYFDSVGILKKQYQEDQYQLYWSCHRYLYPFIRSIVCNKVPSIKQIPQSDRDQLFGKLSSSNDGETTRVEIEPIGASAPKPFEQLWRVYGQLREIAFIRNDGFQIPRVFDKIDPRDTNLLDVTNKVNHVFLSPVGRTHYSRALMEGPTLNDNLFITRDGVMAEVGGRRVLTINNAYVWISLPRYRQLLSTNHNDESIDSIIENEKKSKYLNIWSEAKGVMIATRFTSPVIIGSVVTLHHHRLEHQLSNAGYPTTDKSPFLYELTYNKSLYPLIFNPPDQTGVLLPPEIDWLQVETLKFNHQDQKALEAIKERLVPFIQTYPIIIVKGSAESGARNLQRFDFNKDQDEGEGAESSTSPAWKETLMNACRFILNVSRSQNVVIQRAIISSPLFWMSQSAIDRMVTRQINDHGVSVELHRHPKDTVYGTLRIIMSASSPPTNSNQENIWKASHPIALNSLQIATNVGRQGSLEMLTPDMLSESLKDIFMKRLEDAGSKVMQAMARFGPIYWNEPSKLIGENILESYHTRFPNVREKDANGVPIWWPRYLMLDFIAEPVWKDKRKDELVSSQDINNCSIQLVDIIPASTKTNRKESIFTLIDNRTGAEFEAEVVDVRFWQLEPNVGIGLWPNYWRRELEHQQQLVKAGHQTNIEWNEVGKSDRIVLENFLQVGKQFISSINMKDDNLVLIQDDDDNNDNDKGDNKDKHIDQDSPTSTSTTNVIPSTSSSSSSTNVYIEKLINNEDLKIEKDNPELFLKKGLQLINDSVFGKELLSLNDETKQRIVQYSLDQLTSYTILPINIDILNNPLSNPFQSSLISLDEKKKTLAIIVGKFTLMNHHFYPFMSAAESPVNVIGIHHSWIKIGDNQQQLQHKHMAYVNRCITISKDGQSLIEFTSARSIPLHSCYLLELPNSIAGEETILHQKLDRMLGKECGINVLNPFDTSYERCDDKYWMKSKFNHLLSVTCLKRDECLTEKHISDKLPNSSTGYIIQSRKGTTESESVQYIQQLEDKDEVVNIIMDRFDNGLEEDEENDELLVSPFIKSIGAPNPRPFILRLNACIGDLTTCAIVQAGGGNETIISPHVRGSKWVRFMSIFSKDPQDGRIQINRNHWSSWCGIAQSIRCQINLPIVGIDFIITTTNQQLTAVPLEANARPGSLIMSELPQFDHINGDLIDSKMISPISFDFFNIIKVETNQIDNQQNQEDKHTKSSTASTFNSSQNLTIQQILSDHLSSINQFKQCDIIKDRYCIVDGENDQEQEEKYLDRLETLKQLCQGAIDNGFDSNKKCVVIGSNGRDRIFMGHSDLKGLGGYTIDATTPNEILCIGQILSTSHSNDDEDGQIILCNQDDQKYQSHQISIKSIMDLVKNDVDYFKKHQILPKLFDKNNWYNYINSCLAFILSPLNDYKLESILKRHTLIFRFSAMGKLGLTTNVGVSSSSALTGAFSLALDRLLNLNISIDKLCKMDFGEYYLGNNAGAADKTAQLYAKKGNISIVGSIPERFIRVLPLASCIDIFMTISPTPRLSSSPNNRKWLQNQIDQGKLNKEKVNIDSVIQWANNIMKSFGSDVFITSVKILTESTSPSKIDESSIKSGIDKGTLSIIHTILKESPLLRELASGGELERIDPSYSSKNGKSATIKRYRLIYQLLKLLPIQIDREGDLPPLYPRQSVLYGLSELERGDLYQQLMTSLSTNNNNNNNSDNLSTVIKLIKVIKSAHDGDRQLKDYRNSLQQSKWTIDVSDETLDKWIESLNSNDANIVENNGLAYHVGGLQRSLVEIDELADELEKKFNGLAALRIAAAGLGGSVCVHCHKSISKEVVQFLEQNHYQIRKVNPSSSTNLLY